MTRFLAACVVVLSCVSAIAQDVTAFIDYMDRLYVFDRGTIRQIEPRKPLSLFVGGNYLAYTDNRDDLKVYWNGRTQVVDRAMDLEPIVTDHLMGFTLAGILKVFDGKTRLLTPNLGMYVVEDSLAVFKDEVQGKIMVYYKGEKIKLEDQLAGNAVVDYGSGDNVFAWVSSFDRLFKVFYRGEIYELSDLVTGMDFKCGLDLVAYRDAYDHTFKAFHQGTIYDLEEQMPRRFEVGKGVLAWLDLTGSLKVFEGGRVYKAMDFEPQHWEVVDSLVVVQDRGFFNVFNRGRFHELERTVSLKWEVSWGTLAYVDVDRTLKVWRKGITEVVVRGQPVQDFRVDRGLVIARLNVNTARIWWRGEIHDH